MTWYQILWCQIILKNETNLWAIFSLNEPRHEKTKGCLREFATR